jgi:hypothetical protein
LYSTPPQFPADLPGFRDFNATHFLPTLITISDSTPYSLLLCEKHEPTSIVTLKLKKAEAILN